MCCSLPGYVVAAERYGPLRTVSRRGAKVPFHVFPPLVYASDISWPDLFSVRVDTSLSMIHDFTAAKVLSLW